MYRGPAIPQLYGSYIFGDSVSGHIWSLRHSDTNVTSVVRLVGEAGISAFGIDPRNREILVLNHYAGTIKRLVYVPPEQAAFPQTLADTGAFSDLRNLSPSPGIVRYEVNVPFWSDHAIKTRWFSLPDPSRTIRFHSESNWFFPAGTVWVKHFELELTNGVSSSRRRIETRFLVKTEPDVYGVTYRWGTDNSNAFLVPDEGGDERFVVYGVGSVRTQLWHYPSRNDCISCHR